MRVIVLIRQNINEVSLLSFLLMFFGFMSSGNSYGQMITHTVNPWPCHTIDNTSSGADGVKFGDINNDGRSDLVVGWEEGGITKLYLNPGPEKVRSRWPGVIIGSTPDVEDAVFTDMNADGKMDILSCSEGNTRKIQIHRYFGRKILNSKKWQQKILPASDKKMQWMYAIPLQVDKKYGIDVVASAKGKNAEIGWFEAPKRKRNLGDWKWHTINPVGWIMSIIRHDMDGDMDTDIVITDRKGDQQGCRWLENPGPGLSQYSTWKSHIIGCEGLEVMFMCIADLESDGTHEMIVCERTEQSIRIYKKHDNHKLKWEETIIALPPFTGRAKSVEVGDLNGDGKYDLIVSTNTYGGGKYGLIWLNGAEISQPGTPKFLPISEMHNAKYDKVELIDLDEDGDLDVIICEENFGEHSKGLGIVWYENQLGMQAEK